MLSFVALGRPWQPKVLDKILANIKEGKRHIVLEAPTGSGKTLIALQLIQQLYNELQETDEVKSYIAVRTINEMTPYGRDIEKFHINMLYKYYIGKRRSCPFYTEGDDKNSKLCSSCLDSGRRSRSPSVILEDLHHGLGFLEEKYVRDRTATVCLFQSLKKLPSSLDIMTYPYILNPEIRDIKELNLNESTLIIDEAQTLESAAEDNKDLTITYVKKVIEDFTNFATNKTGNGPQFVTIKKILEDEVDGTLSLIISIIETFTSRADALMKIERSNLQELIQGEIEDKIEYVHDLIEEEKSERASHKLQTTLRNMFHGLQEFFVKLYDNDYELFADRDGLYLKLLDPAPALAFLNDVHTLLLMSGTMPSKDYISKVWGLTNLEEIKVIPDFKEDYYKVFPKNAKTKSIVDTLTTAYGDREENWVKYAELVKLVFKTHNLSTLVCCPSYGFVSRLNFHLKDFVPTYTEEHRTTVLDVMNSIEGSLDHRMVILAVARGKILEGVEFVLNGSSLIDSVIIAGIPYPVPDVVYHARADKILTRLAVPLPQRSSTAFQLFSQASAITAVRQATGRAIRNPGDKASIYYADRRFKESPSWIMTINYAS